MSVAKSFVDELGPAVTKSKRLKPEMFASQSGAKRVQSRMVGLITRVGWSFPGVDQILGGNKLRLEGDRTWAPEVVLADAKGECV